MSFKDIQLPGIVISQLYKDLIVSNDEQPESGIKTVAVATQDLKAFQNRELNASQSLGTATDQGQKVPEPSPQAPSTFPTAPVDSKKRHVHIGK